MTGRPEPSSPEAGARLARQPRKDTGPELALRRAVHALGLRYRVDAPLPLRGMRRRADLLFVGAKVAVFVDGCFWHGCPLHGTRPKSNSSWWAEKLAANMCRDADTDRRLAEAGWGVVRIWEHEDPARGAAVVATVVKARRIRAPAALR
jgi:DNA mismatch endonuclease (patch repair protein)